MFQACLSLAFVHLFIRKVDGGASDSFPNIILKYSTDKLSWSSAWATCVKNKDNLIRFGDNVTEIALLHFLKQDVSKYLAGAIWTGLHDVAPSGVTSLQWADCAADNTSRVNTTGTGHCVKTDPQDPSDLRIGECSAELFFFCTEESGSCSYDKKSDSACAADDQVREVLTGHYDDAQCKERCSEVTRNSEVCWAYERDKDSDICTLFFGTDPMVCEMLTEREDTETARRRCIEFKDITGSNEVLDASLLPVSDCVQTTNLVPPSVQTTTTAIATTSATTLTTSETTLTTSAATSTNTANTGTSSATTETTSAETGSTPPTTESTQAITGSTSASQGSTPASTEWTPATAGSTQEKTGSTTAETGSTPPTTESTQAITGSTSASQGSTPASTEWTPATAGSTQEKTGSTPASTGSTPALTGSTQASTGSTPVTTGSTPVTTGSTPASKGSLLASLGSTSASSGSTQASTGSAQASTGSSLASAGSTSASSISTPAASRSTPATKGSTPAFTSTLSPETTSSPGTSPARVTYERCVGVKLVSAEEMKKKTEELVEDLTLDKKNLSSYKRTKSSAVDERASAQNVGGVGIFLLVIAAVLIVIPDVITIAWKLFPRQKRIPFQRQEFRVS